MKDKVSVNLLTLKNLYFELNKLNVIIPKSLALKAKLSQTKNEDKYYLINHKDPITTTMYHTMSIMRLIFIKLK